LLGRFFGLELSKINYQNKVDLILPVPLHAAKQNSRGYNQCDGIAQGLSEALSVPWAKEILVKTKATESLSKQKMDRLGRFQTLEKVFDITKPEVISGLRICLVDDVITSGATIEVCVAELLAQGASSVYVLGLATKN
jgi:ComF family protein